MSITLLYGCAQIETTVDDLAKARAFMVEVLGGGPIEQQMAAEITALFPSGAYAVEHFDCGGGLFQVNAPSPRASFAGRPPVHQAYLDRIGPCVTNLNYYVDDIRHARDLLAELGAPIHIEGPSDIIASLADYGPENTRPGGDDRNFYFLGARDLIGLDLELMEPNFRRFSEQTAQWPCFVRPRPATGSGEVELLRLTLAVRDLEATCAALAKIFSPSSRSKPYDLCGDGQVRSFRIGLGGLELEYRQPLSAAGPLARHLDEFGPGVLTADFAASKPKAVLRRAEAMSLSVEADGADLSASSTAPGGRWRIGSRALVGFDVRLEPAQASPLT